jgi:hypothetical protein
MSKAPQDTENDRETADLDEDDMFARRERDRRQGVVTDFVRRAIENTVGQVQSTSNLSRDALHYLLQQGDKGRKEVLRIVAKEVGEFLRHVDISTEVIKVLTNVQMDFSASVKFRQVDGSVKPEISKPDVSVSTHVEDEPPLEPEDPDRSEP